MSGFAIASRPRFEWLGIPLIAGLLGVAVALQPLLAVVAVAFAALTAAASLAGISMTALALGGVLLGHLVTGQLYVIGALPDAFAALLDAVLAVLFVTVALRPNPRSPRSHIVSVAFIALALLSALNPLLPSLGFAVFGLRQILLPVVVLVVVKEAELSDRDVRFILAMLALGWAVNVGLALRQWIVGFTGPETRWIQAQDATYLVGDQFRLMGATQSSQDFGFMAGVAVPAVTAYFFAAQRRLARVALGVFLLLSCTVLFASLIRSGLVGGVIGSIVAAATVSSASAERGRLIGYAGGILGILLALALFAPGKILPENKADTLATRAVSVLNPGADPSFRQRNTEVWPMVIDIVGTHPFGGGPGSAGAVAQARAGEAPFGGLATDNGYLMMAVQLGLVGVLLFVVMLGTWLRDLLAWSRRGVTAASAGAGAVVSLLFAMIASSFWSLVNPSVIFGTLVGLGLRGDGRRGPFDAPATDEPGNAPAAARPRRTQAPRPPRSLPAPGPRPPAPVHPPSAPGPRLLVVASPAAADGAARSYLSQILPAIRERGWPVGVLWSSDGPVDPPRADWERRLVGAEPAWRRQRPLQGAIRAAAHDWRPDLVVSLTPQSDLACAGVRRALGLPWIALMQDARAMRGTDLPLARKATWRAAAAVSYRRADRMLAVSAEVADAARAGLGLRQELVVVSGTAQLVAELESAWQPSRGSRT